MSCFERENPRKSKAHERRPSQRKGDQPRKPKPIDRTAVEKEPDRLHPKAKRLGEDPREIGLDRRKRRRRQPKAKVAVGAYDTKRRLLAAAEARVGCARRIDQQILGGSARGSVPRHDKGFDMGPEAVGGMARHFHDRVRFGADPCAGRRQHSVSRVGNEFMQPNGAPRSRQRAGVPKPISDRGHGLRDGFRPDGSQDRARIVAEAELGFAKSRFVLALGRRQILRGRVDRRRIALRGDGLRVIARAADDFRNRTTLDIVGVN